MQSNYSDRVIISSYGLVLLNQVRVGRGKILNRHEKTFRIGGYVHNLDCGDGVLGVYLCQNIESCTSQM